MIFAYNPKYVSDTLMVVTQDDQNMEQQVERRENVARLTTEDGRVIGWNFFEISKEFTIEGTGQVQINDEQLSHLNDLIKKAGFSDVINREYILTGNGKQIICSARPGYADGDDPNIVGWPICRMPRVDHASIVMNGEEYLLTMHNSQNYSLKDTNHTEVLRIMHKGIAGGWDVEDICDITPEIICGIFVFCRYIEQENEFLIV